MKLDTFLVVAAQAGAALPFKAWREDLADAHD